MLPEANIHNVLTSLICLILKVHYHLEAGRGTGPIFLLGQRGNPAEAQNKHHKQSVFKHIPAEMETTATTITGFDVALVLKC